MRWALFLVLAAVAWMARQVGDTAVADPAASAVLALGMLILGGVLAGGLASRVGLPRITGYLLLGILAGPHVAGLETEADGRVLGLFEELALGLIALTAGGEFRLDILRQRLRPVLALTASHSVGIFAAVGGISWLALSAVAPDIGLAPGQVAAAALVLGVVAVAKSPATTVAIITETRARGELTETVLGVTILKDLVILLMFAWAQALARAWVEGTPVGLGLLRGVGIEIVLSLAVGAVLGVLLGLYLVRVGRHLQLTVLLLALVSTEIGHASDLEHLLVCMAAGFTVRNLFPRAAEGFVAALEEASPPIYVVFFALVGAGLDISAVPAVWLPAAAYVVLRLAVTWLATRLPAAWSGAGPAVVRYGWMGFVAQAGLSLGFAARIRRDLPEIGELLATLVVAAVVVNQLVGPVLWERALRSSGEARDR